MLAQAAVFFTDDGADLQHFIRTGDISGKSAAMPYNPAVMEGIAKAWGQ